MTDNDFLRLRVRLATGVSNGQIRLHELGEEVNVAYGEPQSVHLGESFLVGQGRDVGTEPLERVIDGLHPPPLPDVGRLPQLLHLHLRSHPPPALQEGPAVRGQVRGAVGAAIREGGGRGGEGQISHIVVSIVRSYSAAAVFAVIVLEMSGEEVHIVIQKVICVQVSVFGGLVGEKVVIVEIRRGRERVESGERVQHTVHLCLRCCVFLLLREQ